MPDRKVVWVLPAMALVAMLLLRAADSSRLKQDRIWQHRNLGKAFYENPATQIQAVEEFKKALDLAPDSPRERVNYGLALLRAGKTNEGIAELEKAQKQDPNIPHTWFNLGIAFKKNGEYERAARQFEHMIQLVPDEPVSHYNLAVLYKLTGKRDVALKEFETAAKLNPNLAGPHFQLYNTYRQAGRAEDAARELQIFQEIKKRQAGAAVPEDMEWSYYSEIYETIDPENSLEDEKTAVELKFQDRKLATGFDPATAGLIVLDVYGDGRPDLLAWSARGAMLFRNGVSSISNSGLSDLKNVVSIAAADFNNDGLPDLCVLTEEGASLYVNRKGSFQQQPAQLPAGRYSQAVWLDYDHDYDLDLFLLGEKSALLRNNGAAGFSNHSADFPFVKGHATAGTAYDFIADTNGMDLVVAYQDRNGVLYRDQLAGKYEAVPLEALPLGAKSLAAYDLDNDSWTDLAVAYPAGIRLLLNRKGKFEATTPADSARAPFAFADLGNRAIADLITSGAVYNNLGLGHFTKAAVTLPAASAIAAADFNNDGRMDIALIASDGSLHLLENQTPGRNHWIRVGLLGVKNNKLAAGAKVEVKAGARYQKKIYQGVPLLFGLASHNTADTVRITWPNGLIQNEPKKMAAVSETIKEAERLSGSCPMIFTWNGSKFELITDVLGVAPLGASAGDGQFFPVDHDEYVQIPGESLAATNDRYEIRMTEELREVSYLDQVRLVALDHPSQVEIFTNEKFKSPPFPEFRLYGVRKRIYPRSARDHEGRDVLDRLLRRDRRYPDTFRRDHAGVADLHHLDLDFGKAAPGNRAVLILNGWVDWADGSTFLNMAQQNPAGLILPYLQVKNPAGQWQTVIDDMGIPAGKPKTIAVDLSSRFLSTSREIRIVTNLCVYWDEIFLSEDTSAPPVRLTPVDADTAELRFRGFSKATIHPERKQPESFDYSRSMPVSMWNPTPGLYTGYGDVLPLVRWIDDRFVIMGSGDELRLRFPATRLPALPSGWKRDFLLLVDGWTKDGDANTAFSQTVEPLPFHAMSRYPYPNKEHFPGDLGHRLYLEQYNTRPALRLMRPLMENYAR